MNILPHPKLKRDYVGRLVRTTRELSNGFVTIPTGKKGKVESHSPRGSTLIFDACGCCSMQARISRIQATDIVLLEQA